MLLLTFFFVSTDKAFIIIQQSVNYCELNRYLVASLQHPDGSIFFILFISSTPITPRQTGMTWDM